ncbi:nucleotidyltransferase domain-containing protein [Spirilliplanes yamanashiensis]|uniref:Uncharacterized protein n=2 Tax=Spirilliplanes yamanashiensis TaxID=42233 RepID=A0A8J3YEV2_9ACTN|nr:nucleotidyltransferase domain-containing protein [Spirilliplanes yamanashiensis]GIJ06650.1 hypothetical protein Sya03_60020 [Spirilliplanes yamanashiensis]
MVGELNDGVKRMCTAFLTVADRHDPGLVEGLYLQGSIALGDYRPRVSDIDFVAVTSRAPDPRIVRTVHAELRRAGAKPYFDGLYVRWDDLRRDPGRVPSGIAVHEWRVDPVSRFERHLVTWHVLQQGGVAVRGPSVPTLGIYTDWQELADTTRRNLGDYWEPWLRRKARGAVGLSPWAVSWGVLGVARLRHTLAAGRVTSKSEAAEFALGAYDKRWHRIVREALRIRVGGAQLYLNPWRRRADLVGFVAEAVRG